MTNAEYLEFVEAGGYRTRDLWDERAGRGFSRSSVDTRPSGCKTRRTRGCWRGMFEDVAAAARLAGLRQPGGGRAYARWKGGG